MATAGAACLIRRASDRSGLILERSGPVSGGLIIQWSLRSADQRSTVYIISGADRGGGSTERERSRGPETATQMSLKSRNVTSL